MGGEGAGPGGGGLLWRGGGGVVWVVCPDPASSCLTESGLFTSVQSVTVIAEQRNGIWSHLRSSAHKTDAREKQKTRVNVTQEEHLV